jgi:hypothetical protein
MSALPRGGMFLHLLELVLYNIKMESRDLDFLLDGSTEILGIMGSKKGGSWSTSKAAESAMSPSMWPWATSIMSITGGSSACMSPSGESEDRQTSWEAAPQCLRGAGARAWEAPTLGLGPARFARCLEDLI